VTIQLAKDRRDQALRIWRREVQLLLDLQASAPSHFRKPQRKIVSRARARYDRASADYLDMLKKIPKHGAA